MKTTFTDGDMVRCIDAVVANIIGEERSVNMNAGAIGAVVTVYSGSNGVEAYEIEFTVPNEDAYALATVQANKVENIEGS